jgi:hypothetical protein
MYDPILQMIVLEPRIAEDSYLEAFRFLHLANTQGSAISARATYDLNRGEERKSIRSIVTPS